MSFNGSSIQGLDLQSYTEDLGVYYTGVQVCHTTLAKYVFDKWRMSLPEIRAKN